MLPPQPEQNSTIQTSQESGSSSTTGQGNPFSPVGGSFGKDEAAIGEVHHWTDGDFKKVAPGEWVPVDNESGGQEEGALQIRPQEDDDSSQMALGDTGMDGSELSALGSQYDEDDALRLFSEYESSRLSAESIGRGTPFASSILDEGEDEKPVDLLVQNPSLISSMITSSFSEDLGSERFRQIIQENLLLHIPKMGNIEKKNHKSALKILTLAFLETLERDTKELGIAGEQISIWASEKIQSLQITPAEVSLGSAYLAQYTWAYMPFSTMTPPSSYSAAWFAGVEILGRKPGSDEGYEPWLAGSFWMTVVGPTFYKYCLNGGIYRIAHESMGDRLNMKMIEYLHSFLLKEVVPDLGREDMLDQGIFTFKSIDNPYIPDKLEDVGSESAFLNNSAPFLALTLTYALQYMVENMLSMDFAWDSQDLYKFTNMMKQRQNQNSLQIKSI